MTTKKNKLYPNFWIKQHDQRLFTESLQLSRLDPIDVDSLIITVQQFEPKVIGGCFYRRNWI